LGEVDKAIQLHMQALYISRELGDRESEAKDLGNLGNAYADSGDISKAIQHYEQSLIIHRELGNRFGEGHSPECVNDLRQLF
jgi:tetratricopeptide (TPR) repeat protein